MKLSLLSIVVITTLLVLACEVPGGNSIKCQGKNYTYKFITNHLIFFLFLCCYLDLEESTEFLKIIPELFKHWKELQKMSKMETTPIPKISVSVLDNPTSSEEDPTRHPGFLPLDTNHAFLSELNQDGILNIPNRFQSLEDDTYERFRRLKGPTPAPNPYPDPRLSSLIDLVPNRNY